jgi:hypothetical protein
MVLGPTLEASEVGLTTEETEEAQRQDRGKGMANAAWLSGVVDLAKGVEQRSDGSSHP